MDHIQQVASRLRGLRDALEITVEEMSEKCGVDVSTFEKYERGEVDIPVSLLYKIAAEYGVEMTALLFGEEPKMSAYYVTRSGKGVKVERTKAYSYQDIAAGFRNRSMAPFIVTVEPSPAESPIVFNTHEGQEFNYMLEGEIEISVGGKLTRLYSGDSIMFDSRLPHGFRAVGDKAARFIAIIS